MNGIRGAHTPYRVAANGPRGASVEAAALGAVSVIVLAAGSGSRFGGAKQFALLAGERLVDRAVRVAADAVGPPILARQAQASEEEARPSKRANNK